MERAKRYFTPGYIWHITHRCHKRELLLEFSKDRHRNLQWLDWAKNKYKLTILNPTVTSNHVHLFVVDTGKRDVNPTPHDFGHQTTWYLHCHIACDNFLNCFTEYLLSIFRVITTHILRRYSLRVNHYFTYIVKLGPSA